MQLEPIVASTRRPVLRRPDMPAHWELDEVPAAFEAYDEALAAWSDYAGDHSLPNHVVGFLGDEDGAVTYTILLDSRREQTWRRLGGVVPHDPTFGQHLLDLNASKLGVNTAELRQYVAGLFRYWKVARSKRTEFVRWLDQNQVTYDFVESKRSFGSKQTMPWLDVRVTDAHALSKLASKTSEWPSTLY